MPDTVIPAERLVRAAAAILTAADVPSPDALLIAESLVDADASGHPSHGLLRLGRLVDRLRSGAMSAVCQATTVLDAGALGIIDGRDGIGQVVVERACADAVARAKSHGVGVVAVRWSNHIGTAQFWTRRMSAQGCVGILFSNASPAMAPWGGSEKRIGTNPWSIAVPGGSTGDVVLDIGNTAVAKGKIFAAQQRGETIPDTWAVGPDGRPTSDPAEALDGLLLPLGGHKGYAMSFLVDILAGVLTGSAFGTDVAGPFEADRRSGCGHLVIALDIAALADPTDFARRVGDLVAATKASSPAPGTTEILIPGEPEERARAAATTAGIRLSDQTLRDLEQLALAAGLGPIPLPAA